MYNYKNYITSIKEGLIKTYNIERYENSLYIELKSYGLDFEIKIENKYKYSIIVIVNNFFKRKESFDLFFSVNNNIGYYPSYMNLYKYDIKNGSKFDKDILYNQLDNLHKIEIIFESKYEDGLYKNDLDVPDIAYHVSPSKNREKINKNGLCPKSGSRKTYHNDRIYLFYDTDKVDDIIKKLKTNDYLIGNEYEYDLYEVSLTDDNIIHTDPNYENGFYTYDNISPMKMKILDKDI